MFEHLVTVSPEQTYAPTIMDAPRAGFKPLEEATPNELLDAQVKTTEWLASMGAPESRAVITEAQLSCARASFTTMTTTTDAEEQRSILMQNKAPAAVRQLVAMLAAYDWEFIEQAKELRGYAMAQILKECENKDARHRLRALEMLGKITEVGLFTERVHITKTDLTDEALDIRIKAKLARFRHVVDVPAERAGTTDVIDVTDVIEQMADPAPNSAPVE